MTWAVFDEAASSGVTFSTITDGGTEYRLATITTGSAALVFSQGGDIEALLVAGGASGARGRDFAPGGGGGAGGVLERVGASALSVTASTYAINVGLGGTAPVAQGAGNAGGDTTAFGLTAAGGGPGGLNSTDPAQTGGSGGGGGNRSNEDPAPTGASGTSGQGSAGGDSALEGLGAQTAAGGGGGAGGVGGDATSASNSGGVGGAEIFSSITGTSLPYGGGGGGGSAFAAGDLDTSSPQGTGGSGSRYDSSTAAESGVDGRGGGGGGGGDTLPPGDGGNGIVYVRVETRPPSTGTRVHGLRLLSPARLDASALETLVAGSAFAGTYHVGNSIDWSGITGLLAAWAPWDETTRFTTSGGSTQAGATDPVGRLEQVAGSIGSGADLIQATSGERPTVTADGAGLSLDGSQGLYTTSAISVGDSVVTAVFIWESQTASGRVFELSDNAGDDVNYPAFRVEMNGDPDVAGAVFDSTTTTDNRTRYEVSDTAESSAAVIFVEMRNDTSTGEVRIWSGTTERTTTVPFDGKSSTGNFASAVLNFGAQAAGGTLANGITGELSPVAVIAGALDASDRSYINTEVRSKAGL